MAPATPRLRILSVGGNAVSAFLSWRLQATNACDVTLVWKSGYDAVAQYGISIKSQQLGNERFKPYAVVRTPEEATQASKVPFDYVLLCVKALPDVYDLAQIIQSVVTPQHTCILLNTTNSIGIEEFLEERYSTNVVLSLVCGADLTQLGPAEFEHKGASSNMWVGWANKNPSIPQAIQRDMAEALAMTLSTAQVECLVSLNIRQQQMEKMIGPIAFHPTSVVFNNPNHSQLYDQTGVATMINGIIDELLGLAIGLGCEFPPESREAIITSMRVPSAEVNSVMYQDFLSRRPMEIETFLGSPLKLAKKLGLTLPRLEVIYALLHDKNQKNLKGETPPSPGPNHGLPPRTSSIANTGPGARPMTNGKARPMPGSRAPSLTGPPPAMRRGPYSNGYRNGSVSNGYPSQGGIPFNRRDSADGENLEEFSHVMLYENTHDSNFQDGSSGSFGDGSGGTGTPSSSELALRERELAIRQREIELKEREQHMHMRRGPPQRRQGRAPAGAMFDDEDDEDDYFDPMSGGGRAGVTDENIDMMSITSRRHKKAPSNHHQHQQPPSSRGSNLFARKNRSSTRLMADIPSPHDSIMQNPLLGYSSNRYGTVDRQALGEESRHNSMAGSKIEEFARAANGAYPGTRRLSQSPGNPLAPPPANRPSPPNGYMNGMRPNGPPLMHGGPMQRPGMPRGVQSMPIEQHVGVSNSLYPPKPYHQVRNLTGSASASAPSGDSASANTGSANSAASSSSSLQPRQQSYFHPTPQAIAVPR